MDTPAVQSGECRRKRRRKSSLSICRDNEDGSSSQHQEHGHMRPSRIQGSSSFVGSGSGIYFVRAVQSAFSRNHRPTSETVAGELVPGEDDQLQVRALEVGFLWHPEEVTPATTQALSSQVTFDNLVHWSQPFFTNWHPPFPFLHGPTVLGILERISLSGIQELTDAEAMIARSVLSISVADRRQMPVNDQIPLPSSLVFNTIDEAISCLTSILLQPSTLVGLQSAVAIQVFLISMLRLNAASRIGGLITRMVFHLGLHRCPSKYKQFTTQDSDMRRRVFWTIYTLSRTLSQSLGLPLDLKDDDIDVCYPDKEHHVQNPESANGNQQTQTTPRSLMLPMCLSRHSYIKGLILELRHKTLKHRQTDPLDVAYVDSEISKWWNEAQDLLEPYYETEGDTGKPNVSPLQESHKIWLIVQHHESVILLNRPVITSAEDSSLYAAAMQKCIGASKQIVSVVYQHLYTNTDDIRGSEGRMKSPLCWPGLAWCIWMSGLILLYAASAGHYPIRNAQRQVVILENLSLRGNFWPGACATALEDLRKALGAKLVGTTQDTNNVNSTKARGICRSTSHTTTEVAQTVPAQPVEGDFRQDVTQQRNDNSIVSPTFSTPEAGLTNQVNSHQNNQDDQMTTFISDRNRSIPFQSNEGALSYQNWSTDFGPLQDTLGPFDLSSNQFDGVGDIFQLMDASYQWSD
ncbi:hypothetical protein HYFRA_00008154 [Hymenoscyphus fraxineus]|uniref:Xylanolytic transcriptional activator regulatory domain-containing protein n=1 Tax=Hymenoscyphus fraxineus TaxID=746836 RepID=A0A9N9LA17_9HELO|nr:hypothetical protein HYFRA_00008154 [Hymenoscyphus fraxineus]